MYKLTYFDVHGLGEQIRLLLKDNEIPFEDDRIQWDDQWPQLKKKMVFGQIPQMTLRDGFQLCQSGAIMKHLARQFDLYGTCETDRCYLDMFYDGLRDLDKTYANVIYKQYDTKELYIAEILPDRLKNIEKLLRNRGNGQGPVLGVDRKVSFVDYMLFELMHVLQVMDPDCLTPFTALQAHFKYISDRPNIRTHIQSDLYAKKDLNSNGKV